MCAQLRHAELLAIIGSLEKHTVDTCKRAAHVKQGGPFAQAIPTLHVVVVVSRPSCSSCKMAMKHLAKCLKLRITVAQSSINGPLFVATFG